MKLEYNRGFSTTELNKIETIVQDNQAHLLKAWHAYFQSGN